MAILWHWFELDMGDFKLTEAFLLHDYVRVYSTFKARKRETKCIVQAREEEQLADCGRGLLGQVKDVITFQKS
jgi:hypothetical protein